MKPDRPSAAVSLVGLAAALGILRYFRSVLWPFAAAAVLAVLIQALVGAMARAWPRAPRWAVPIVAAAMVGALLFAGAAVTAAGTQRFAAEWPVVSLRLDALLGQASARFGLAEPLSVHVLLKRIDLPALASGVAANLNEAGSGLVLMFLFLLFLLAGGRSGARKLHELVAPETSSRLAYVLRRTVRGIEAYVLTQTVYGVAVAIGSGLLMAAFGLSGAAFWAFIIFLLAFVPVLGVAVAGAAPALMALVQFPTIAPAVVIFLGIQALGFVVGNLILPRLVAKSVNIDPLASLLALGLWGTLWGVPGAFLAVPMTVILMLQLAQDPQLRWIAVLISNDGRPLPDPEPPPAPLTS